MDAEFDQAMMLPPEHAPLLQHAMNDAHFDNRQFHQPPIMPLEYTPFEQLS
jgi:hypothetical protein